MLVSILTNKLRVALNSMSLSPRDAEFVRASSLDHGHYQSNIALRLAKELKEDPRDLANRIVKEMLEAELCFRTVPFGVFEVAGPGFINLRMTSEYLQEIAVWLLFWEDGYGLTTQEMGQRILIDFSSPNIAKRMHVGHLRSTVIGNALANIHTALGAEVVRDNHVGDFGTPFGKLLVAWGRWADKDSYNKDPVGELQRLYAKFGQEEPGDPQLMDQARAATLDLQAGKPESTKLWKDFKEKSMLEFQGIYDRLGVTFTRIRPESYYQFRMERDCQRLWDSGVVTLENDAFISRWVKPGTDQEEVVVLRKRDGASTYMMSEVSTYFDRLGEGLDRIIVVTDNRQTQHFSQVQRIVDQFLGPDSRHPELEHVPFGILRIDSDGEKTLMSSRSGEVLNLSEVLDEAQRRSRAILDESGSIPERDRSSLSDKIGGGSIIYSDLRQNPSSDISFNWDSSLSMTGNTAPYLMYSYARSCSVLRKAGIPGFRKFRREALAADLAEPSAELILLLAAQYPEIVVQAGKTNRPHVIAGHLFLMAQAFGTFWSECEILVENPTLRSSRILAVRIVNEVLNHGLGLLGIHAPESM